MSISYYDTTVPVFIKNLENLKAFMAKGVAHAAQNSVAETDFLALQLSPDMFPLIRQIQISTDNAKGAVARLTGATPLALPDTETTWAELSARVDTVIEHLRTFTPGHFEKAGEAEVSLPYFPGKYFTGHDYLVEYVLPNFFFHINMAYAIIRSSGVPLGKGDYLGSLTLHDVKA
ncbi:DUF1993 domain-containing protein [Patescibacteria group bacterium]|nr:DUF1993 domain-containing protein [Patescibacteria group bacterium]